MTETNNTPQGGEQTPPAKMFTQEELDAHIKTRLDREKTKYADYDQLKAAAAKLTELESAGKTEAQKLADQLAQLQKDLATKDAAIAERDAKLLAEIRRAKVSTTAQAFGALDPTDANIIQATAEIDINDPKADATINAALTALKEKKPYLFAGAGQPAGGQPPPGQPKLTPFNPAPGAGEVTTDAQRLRNLLAKTGQGSYGPLA
jgi:hypothetical protein